MPVASYEVTKVWTVGIFFELKIQLETKYSFMKNLRLRMSACLIQFGLLALFLPCETSCGVYASRAQPTPLTTKLNPRNWSCNPLYITLYTIFVWIIHYLCYIFYGHKWTYAFFILCSTILTLSLL